ncbi:hypothetical protein [Aeromonas phage AS-sw]|uniref:Uncharacterized protein n=1 Tax=Aeromonas phage AS-sw TaxID=2026113 RepID=A0A291LFC1_9CAUD|nr:hypothetical protein HWB29_gp048 [Aeromonas phage AS-sw]ATI18098.1 hypothetical protein [Aeromonas phage AS-sw]
MILYALKNKHTGRLAVIEGADLSIVVDEYSEVMYPFVERRLEDIHHLLEDRHTDYYRGINPDDYDIVEFILK